MKASGDLTFIGTLHLYTVLRWVFSTSFFLMDSFLMYSGSGETTKASKFASLCCGHTYTACCNTLYIPCEFSVQVICHENNQDRINQSKQYFSQAL